jgi:hypothetical protein
MNPALFRPLAISLAMLGGLFSLPHTSQSEVVRPAPNFSVQVSSAARPIQKFQGQQIVLLLADSPSTRAFRRQVRELETLYDRFAANRVLFVAAFRTTAGEEPVSSNIPFLLADSGAAVMEQYGVKSKFGIALIGADGNLDYVTERELRASRVREVLQNSFTVQQAARRSSNSSNAPGRAPGNAPSRPSEER